MLQPTQIYKNHDLKPYNTFAIAAKTKLFAKVENLPQLQWLLKQELDHDQMLVLGGGSNILLTQNFSGLVIQNAITGLTITQENHDHVWLQVGAGVNWHSLVLYCVDKNYGGIENLSLIPGTVGAAPIQNIGAYGVEFKDVFVSLEALHLQTGAVNILTSADCQFGYRDSVFKNQFKNHYIILTVTLKLTKNPQFNLSYGALQNTLAEMQIKEISIRDVSNAVIKIRQSKLPDPKVIPNAGSFFKNPHLSLEHYQQLKQKYPDIPAFSADTSSGEANNVKIPAAWLIEQCGWKGYRSGNFGVHPAHALVLVNYKNASGNEIWQLAKKIQHDVYTEFKIKLTPEVIVS
jgi:UDP-N-acetylmuramate dehydrogenase